MTREGRGRTGAGGGAESAGIILLSASTQPGGRRQHSTQASCSRHPKGCGARGGASSPGHGRPDNCIADLRRLGRHHGGQQQSETELTLSKFGGARRLAALPKDDDDDDDDDDVPVRHGRATMRGALPHDRVHRPLETARTRPALESVAGVRTDLWSRRGLAWRPADGVPAVIDGVRPDRCQAHRHPPLPQT